MLIESSDQKQLLHGGVTLDGIGKVTDDDHVAPDVAKGRDDAVEGRGARANDTFVDPQLNAEGRAVLWDMDVSEGKVEGDTLLPRPSPCVT